MSELNNMQRYDENNDSPNADIEIPKQKKRQKIDCRKLGYILAKDGEQVLDYANYLSRRSEENKNKFVVDSLLNWSINDVDDINRNGLFHFYKRFKNLPIWWNCNNNFNDPTIPYYKYTGDKKIEFVVVLDDVNTRSIYMMKTMNMLSKVVLKTDSCKEGIYYFVNDEPAKQLMEFQPNGLLDINGINLEEFELVPNISEENNLENQQIFKFTPVGINIYKKRTNNANANVNDSNTNVHNGRANKRKSESVERDQIEEIEIDNVHNTNTQILDYIKSFNEDMEVVENIINAEPITDDVQQLPILTTPNVAASAAPAPVAPASGIVLQKQNSVQDKQNKRKKKNDVVVNVSAPNTGEPKQKKRKTHKKNNQTTGEAVVFSNGNFVEQPNQHLINLKNNVFK